ncbi:MAG: ABC transporter transmembrane domain-containing protein, partial [Bosea sp. (in: a-proteobacteria)]
MALVLFSGVINILMLTGSFYMLQVYDRVLLSYSVPTLVMLSIIALFAYLFMGFLDVVRTRIFGRIADKVDAQVGPQLYSRVVRQHASRPSSIGEQMQPFRDLDAIRGFLSGTGPVAVFDMPWLPIYLIICFFLHPLIGIFATLSALLLAVVAVAGELMTRKPMKQAFEMSSQRNMLGVGSIGGSEALVSMGMLGAMLERWRSFNLRNSALALRANDVSSSVASISRTLRMVIQSATLGIGAYLVVKGEMTAGTIIAASIISARAIAPIDLAVASYKGFQQAREGYRRLISLFHATT